MKKEELLLEDVASLATSIWYKLVNNPGGHPGFIGPPGSSSSKNDDWSVRKGLIMQIKMTLKEVEEVLAKKSQVTKKFVEED